MTFRLPGVSLVIPFLFFICVTPLANAGPDWLLALYLLPLVGLVYILITRTVADREVIRTTGLLGPRRIAWSDLDGFEFRGPRWAIAVSQDGRRVRLPMVRPRDLPRLAQVSGGRLLLGDDAPQPAGSADGTVGDIDTDPEAMTPASETASSPGRSVGPVSVQAVAADE